MSIARHACWLSIAITLASVGACTPLRGLDPIDAGRAGIDGARADAAEQDAALPDSASVDAACGGPELCNGLDDDCNAATADGSGDPMVGVACDGPDADLCREGTSRCADGGVVTCSDTTSDTSEVCDGSTDEDCDGHVDEAGALSGTTYYADADHDGYGDTTMPIMACTPPAMSALVGGDCNDARATAHPGAPEVCNALDDDCDMLIDDGNPCARCTTHTNAGRTYQLCTTDTLGWDAARTACMADGYDLVIIGSASEQSYVQSLVAAGAIGVWIGLRSDAAGVFTWVDGSALTYSAWASGEPTLTNSCVRTRSFFSGQWADATCTGAFGYLCEAP